MPEPIVARSRQSLWQAFVLAPCAALLLYMVGQSYNPDFARHSGGSVLDVLEPWQRATFFGACAAVCLACVAVVLWRRFFPRIELVLDDRGVTSSLFWGPGTLAWEEIADLQVKGNWLYVRGRDATGRKRRLIIDAGHLDVAQDTVVHTIFARARSARRP